MKKHLTHIGIGIGFFIGWQAWMSFDDYLSKTVPSRRIDRAWEYVWDQRIRTLNARDAAKGLEKLETELRASLTKTHSN